MGVNGKRQRANFAVGFLCSVVLHGLMLLPIMLMLDRATTTLVIPVDVVLAYQTADPPPPDTAFAPQKEVGATSSPAAAPLGVSPSDDLELKLQRLAKLRRSDMDARSSKIDANASRVASISDDAAAESSAVGDIIRAQVERRWSLDLATLGNKTFSVLIHVEITGAGVVTKADIVRDPRFAADKAYQDIALSARNAVLLSSPLALPSGHYSDVMALTVSLNTRDALR